MSQPDEPRDPSPGTCPLPVSAQWRNMLLFAACTGLQYLAAPVLYVGITQASLCDRLGTDAKVANLPATFYFAMTAMPALIAWLFPAVRHLKRVLSLCYASIAAVLLLVAVVLASDVANEIKVAAVILQGAVSGAAGPTAIALLWEVIGRGTDASRRGLTLSLAFGAGPILAVIGSIGQVALLGGELFGWRFAGLESPDGFVWLFGLGAPVMAIGAVLGGLCVVPQPDVETQRAPLSEVLGLCVGLALGFASLALFFTESGGTTNAEPASHEVQSRDEPRASDATAAVVERGPGRREVGFLLLVAASIAVVYHFRDILSQRTLLIATIVTILVYSGNTIPSNMNLYSPEVLGDLPEKYAGLQNTLRFGFKVAAGFFLGWLLSRTNPRAGILTTAGIFVAAQAWAIFATGTVYLVAFGLYGAGELVGVYAPNYLLSAARKQDYRRVMAFATMLMVPAAPTGYVYGAVVDALKPQFGAPFAFRVSFSVCALLIVTGIVLALALLPPAPREASNGRPE